MTINAKKIIKYFSLLFFMMLCIDSHATLIGDEMTADWTYPVSGYHDTNTFVASSGIDLIEDFANSNLDVTENSIIVDILGLNVVGLASSVQWDFLGIDASDGDIVDVIVNTNYLGWSDTFLSFDAHNIHVNFLNSVSFSSADDIFELIVVTANTSVPEPSSILLLGLGLAGIGFAKRKKV